MFHQDIGIGHPPAVRALSHIGQVGHEGSGGVDFREDGVDEPRRPGNADHVPVDRQVPIGRVDICIRFQLGNGALQGAFDQVAAPSGAACRFARRRRYDGARAATISPSPRAS